MWELASNFLADAELVDPRDFAATDVARTLKKFQKALKSVTRLAEGLKRFEKPGLKYPRADNVDQHELLETVTEGLRVGWWAMQTSHNLDRLLASARIGR
jgi:hypothetical protein